LDIEKQILNGYRKSGKHYAFDETHDPGIPADFWFQESIEGLVLFIVFYTQACRWSRCLGCNLPAKMSKRHISYKYIIKQIDHLFQQLDIVVQFPKIQKVIVSNNGSVLDQETFSSTALMYLLAKINLHLSNLAVLSLETRAEYVDFPELEFIARAINEGDTPTRLEIAIGFEAFDDDIRNGVFDKGLTLDVFNEFVKTAAPYKYLLKTYFMQKPVPQMTDENSIHDIHQAIDYLDKISNTYQISINMHLNPTYVARGTPLEDFFDKGQYNPPFLKDVAKAAIHARHKSVSVYLGLSDEGLSVSNGSFIRPGDENLVRKLEEFNRTQDYNILENIITHPDLS